MEPAVLNQAAEPSRAREDAPSIRRSFVVNIERGLHARPCVLLIKTLKRFRSKVLVEAKGRRAPGSSILSLLMLAAEFGSPVTFTITGEDAAEAMSAVERLFATRFEEAYQASAKSACSGPTLQRAHALQP